MAEQMVTVPGVMGQMSLATAQAAGFTNYTPVAPLIPVNVNLPEPVINEPAPAVPSVSLVNIPGLPSPVPMPTSQAQATGLQSVVITPTSEQIAQATPIGVTGEGGTIVLTSGEVVPQFPEPVIGASVVAGAAVGVESPNELQNYLTQNPGKTMWDFLDEKNKELYPEEEVAKKTILGTATDAVAELNTSPIAKLVGAGAGTGALAGVNPNPAADIQNTPIGQLAGSGGIFTGSLGIGLAGPSAPVVNTPVVNTPVIGGIDLSGINFSGVDMSGAATESKPNVAPVVVDKGFFGNMAAGIQGQVQGMAEKVITDYSKANEVVLTPVQISEAASALVQKQAEERQATVLPEVPQYLKFSNPMMYNAMVKENLEAAPIAKDVVVPEKGVLGSLSDLFSEGLSLGKVETASFNAADIAAKKTLDYDVAEAVADVVKKGGIESQVASTPEKAAAEYDAALASAQVEAQVAKNEKTKEWMDSFIEDYNEAGSLYDQQVAAAAQEGKVPTVSRDQYLQNFTKAWWDEPVIITPSITKDEYIAQSKALTQNWANVELSKPSLALSEKEYVEGGVQKTLAAQPGLGALAAETLTPYGTYKAFKEGGITNPMAWVSAIGDVAMLIPVIGAGAKFATIPAKVIRVVESPIAKAVLEESETAARVARATEEGVFAAKMTMTPTELLKLSRAPTSDIFKTGSVSTQAVYEAQKIVVPTLKAEVISPSRLSVMGTSFSRMGGDIFGGLKQIVTAPVNVPKAIVKSPTGALKTGTSMAKEMVSTTTYPFIHPIKTTKAWGGLLTGSLEYNPAAVMATAAGRQATAKGIKSFESLTEGPVVPEPFGSPVFKTVGVDIGGMSPSEISVLERLPKGKLEYFKSEFTPGQKVEGVSDVYGRPITTEELIAPKVSERVRLPGSKGSTDVSVGRLQELKAKLQAQLQTQVLKGDVDSAAALRVQIKDLDANIGAASEPSGLMRRVAEQTEALRQGDVIRAKIRSREVGQDVVKKVQESGQLSPEELRAMARPKNKEIEATLSRAREGLSPEELRALSGGKVELTPEQKARLKSYETVTEKVGKAEPLETTGSTKIVGSDRGFGGGKVGTERPGGGSPISEKNLQARQRASETGTKYGPRNLVEEEVPTGKVGELPSTGVKVPVVGLSVSPLILSSVGLLASPITKLSQNLVSSVYKPSLAPSVRPLVAAPGLSPYGPSYTPTLKEEEIKTSSVFNPYIGGIGAGLGLGGGQAGIGALSPIGEISLVSLPSTGLPQPPVTPVTVVPETPVVPFEPLVETPGKPQPSTIVVVNPYTGLPFVYPQPGVTTVNVPIEENLPGYEPSYNPVTLPYTFTPTEFKPVEETPTTYKPTPKVPFLPLPFMGAPRVGEGYAWGTPAFLKGSLGRWLTKGYSVSAPHPITGKMVTTNPLKKAIKYGNVRKKLGAPVYKVVRAY